MKQVPLGEVAEFVNGYAFNEQHWQNEGKPIIRIQNLTDKTKPFNRTRHDPGRQFCVVSGDVLVSWSATLDVFVWDGEDALLNQHIFVVKPDYSQVDKAYLLYALRKAVDSMAKHTHGSTMKHVNRGAFLSTSIPLPSVAEQRRIAAILDKADAIRRKRREALKLADEFLRAAFLDLFGDPVTNPKSWPTEKLGLLGDLQRGKSRHRPRDEPALYGGSYPFIQTGDVANCDGVISAYSQTYSDLGLQQSRLWPQGTLCITIAANIGNTGILGFDACFPDSVVGFKPWEKVTVEYIQYWLNGIQSELDRAASQVAQKNINLEILSTLDTMLPPISQQHRFSAIVQKVRSSKSRYKKANLEAESLFTSLSHRAFQGTL